MNPIEPRPELDVIDAENYSGSSDSEFSHQTLVMRAMQKCLEAGCREMKSGFFNEKTDRMGNVIRTYIEDTRMVMIESIETCEMVMISDFDDEAETKINKIKEDLDKRFKQLCEEEFQDWKNLPLKIKHDRWANGILYRKGSLNINLPFYQEFIDEQVKAYRNIFKELTKLSNRRDYYKDSDIEN